MVSNKFPLVYALTWVTVLACAAVRADDQREPIKQYRVIFNCDGHAVCANADGDLNQWIENVFAPLEKSHVDALFWCDGAGGNTANYESEVLELTGQRIGKPRPWVQKLLDQGYDPPKIIVQEAKKRGLDVFYSFRINDIHDSFTPDELATFKVEHPEWLLGEQTYGEVTGFGSSLNFAIPEVRELKFRIVEELFQKYDFDGLEIDFMRSAPYFMPGEEAKHSHLLTELLQRIRKHLDERGRQRGRPIRLAARVEGSLVACHRDGFEISQWIDDGLIDYLILGTGVIDIEVEAFKKLAAPHGVLVYPCLYGWPSKYYPIPPELAVGLALNYWQQGADGIYLFNWFPHTQNNSEKTGLYMTPLLKQLGDPARLRAKQKHLMFAADRGRPPRDNPYSRLHCVLPKTLSEGEPLQVKIQVSEKFRDDVQVTLQIEVEELQAGDVVAVKLNDLVVNDLTYNKTNRLVAPVAPGSLHAGANQVILQLQKQADHSAKSPTVTALELHIERRLQVRAEPGLFDQSKTDTLGLPTLESKSAVIYKATKDGYKFCHHPSLVVFNNRLYAMWSNGKEHEDSNGQRILNCSTSDGITFDRAFVVRSEPTKMRFQGKSKLAGWQYPSAVAWRGQLYIAYSINKEDIGITRVELKNL